MIELYTQSFYKKEFLIITFTSKCKVFINFLKISEMYS